VIDVRDSYFMYSVYGPLLVIFRPELF